MKELDSTLFHKKSRNKDKLDNKCIQCVLKKVHIESIHKDGTQKCYSCKKFKILDEFSVGKREKSGFQASCKLCTNKKSIEYRNRPEVKNRLKAYADNWRLVEAESIKIYRSRPENLIKKKLYSRVWAREKSKNDPKYRLNQNIRTLIRISLDKKSRSTESILGCTMVKFKSHIESQFLNWMSWDNYGNCTSCEKTWDLDHIIPISSARSEEEVYILNHWSNFQPLESFYNRAIKRDKVPLLTNLELNITII